MGLTCLTGEQRPPTTKTKLIILVGCAALLGCANDQAYWDRQRALIAQLPPSQRAAAEMELEREQHAEMVARRQALGQAIQRAGHDFGESVSRSTQPAPLGSYANPIYVAPTPMPIQAPSPMPLIPTGY